MTAQIEHDRKARKPRTRHPLRLAGAAAALICLCGSLRSLPAEPIWWTGPFLRVPQVAEENGLGIVLYFYSPPVANVQRLDQHTWPHIAPDGPAENFIWYRAQPQTHPNFFAWWEVYQVPEIVIFDFDMNEQARFQGFIGPETLNARLQEVSSDLAAVRELTGAAKNADPDVIKGYDFYESFDTYNTMLNIPPNRLHKFDTGMSSIEPESGLYGSPGLIANSGIQGRCKFYLDLTPQRPAAPPGETAARVRLHLRSNRFRESVWNPVSISLSPRNESPDTLNALRYPLPLAPGSSDWREFSILTDAFDPRRFNLYLRVAVNRPGIEIGIDDIRVELLDPDAASEDLEPTAPQNFLIQNHDANANGRVELNELRGVSSAKFDPLDLNDDGAVSNAEANAYFYGSE